MKSRDATEYTYTSVRWPNDRMMLSNLKISLQQIEGNIKLLPCALQLCSYSISISLTLVRLVFLWGAFQVFHQLDHFPCFACYLGCEIHMNCMREINGEIHIKRRSVCVCVLVCLRIFNEWIWWYSLCEHTAFRINPFPLDLVTIHYQGIFCSFFFAFIVNSVYYYCIKWEKHVFHTTFFWEIFSWNFEGLSQQNGVILDWSFHLSRLALAESKFMFVN